MDKEAWTRISLSVHGLLQYRHRQGFILPYYCCHCTFFHFALYSMQRGLHIYSFNKYLLVPGYPRPCG